MTTANVENEVNNLVFNEKINKAINHILPQFYRAIKSYALFNFLFFAAFSVEFIFLVFFFTFLVKSSLLAIGLALIFLTVFSYFILRLYFQTKFHEQLKELQNRFLNASKQLILYREGVPEQHLALSNACYRFVEILAGVENNLYTLPSWLRKWSPIIEKVSNGWHELDIYRMKELVLMSAIDENIKLVKCEPTSLEAHAALANAYVTLSALYAGVIQKSAKREQISLSTLVREEIQKKFRTIAERAIEELKILHDYAPEDPWVLAQLAYSYHDLKMPLEEIKQYEAIMQLRNDDRETLYKLGVLYFQQGMNAKGLSIYEKLKSSHFKKAEQLIEFYGAYKPFE